MHRFRAKTESTRFAEKTGSAPTTLDYFTTAT
jgi:hypothetical protein